MEDSSFSLFYFMLSPYTLSNHGLASMVSDRLKLICGGGGGYGRNLAWAAD